MEGPGDGTFQPYSTLTVGEALKMAAVLDSTYAGRTFSSGGDPWYTNAVNYCLTNGIITDTTFSSYTRPITRAELALVLAATAPVREADDINDAGRVASSIPDVAGGDFAASSIYALYAKGIVSGSDKQLTFRPEAVITRSEVPPWWPASPGRSSASSSGPPTTPPPTTVPPGSSLSPLLFHKELSVL